ncbi:hypothetical protein ACHAXS_006550 [Conticribra weissflogii]
MTLRSFAALTTFFTIISFYCGYFTSIIDNYNDSGYANHYDLASKNTQKNYVPSHLVCKSNNMTECFRQLSKEEAMRDIQQDVTSRVMMKLHSILESKNSPNNYIDHFLFPLTTSKYATGMLRVSKDKIMNDFDFGVPKSVKTNEDSDALILYSNPQSLPREWPIRHEAIFGKSSLKKNGVSSGRDIGNARNLTSALSNCDTLNVIFPDSGCNRPSEKRTCLAVIGDFESYHKNRWSRIPQPPQKGYPSPFKIPMMNSSIPLRHVGRISIENEGMDEFPAPPMQIFEKKGTVYEHWKSLKNFLENVDSVLNDIAAVVSKTVQENTVVVMTVNQGQSELLANFVCSARSRGFDVSNVIVFPMDIASKKLADGFGLANYYDESNLKNMPLKEAQSYGDETFATLMWGKILPVLYINLLGYDLLFQDVDVIWLSKNPLSFFHSNNSAIKNYDIMLQHDGSPQPRFAPYSANSGFYYARSNKRTNYFFTSLLYQADLVRVIASHQQVLVQLLLEHSSLFGLKVKVFDKIETDYFPGGYHFHRDHNLMKNIVIGKSNAFIFHMSWTDNKKNKVLFLQQMGEWYLKENCIGNDKGDATGTVENGELISTCCSAEPLLTCHFKDKPSKIPCPDSPMMDKNGASFW